MRYFSWWPVFKSLRLNKQGKLPAPLKIYPIAQSVIGKQLQITAIPKRFTMPMQETYALQSGLEFCTGKKALNLLEKKRFRMAYDFLGLRAVAGNADKTLFEWWTRIQEVDADERSAMAHAASKNKPKTSRKKRKKR